MTEDTFVPELHDIGKLIDWKNTNQDIKGHNFEGVNWQKLGIQKPSNKTWQGITEHHGTKKSNIDIFLLRLADQMASGISRAFSNIEKDKLEKGNILKTKENKKTFLKLWKQKENDIELFSTNEHIQKIVDFINIANNAETYFELEFFKEKLLLKPEDEMPPLNITSLYTHSKLVGKLYRFFKSMITEKDGHFYLGEDIGITPDDKKDYEYIGNKRNAYQNWQIKLVYCKIETPNYFSRIKDLNIFEILKEESEKISKLDNVILQTSDQLLVFLPSKKKIDELIKPFLDKGFIIKVEEAHTNLDGVSPTPRAAKIKKLPSLKSNDDLDKLFPTFTKILNPEPVLESTICEICQLAPASEKWIDEELTENICRSCWDIRKFEDKSPAPKLEKWYLNEGQSKVAWIKIHLDVNFLNDTIKYLFKDYIEKYIKETGITKDDINFSVLAEFQNDYNLFLKNFNENLENHFGTENIQPILNDFLCIKLERTSKIKNILEIYNNLFTDFFPKLKEQESPISFSVSVSNVKFAFFRHWKILDDPKNDVNVTLIGRGGMHITFDQLDALKDFKIPASKQLHKLAKISETSEKLAKVLVYDRGDYRVYKDFEPIREKSKQIDFKTILTYAKIIGDEE
ncbi:MAG: hypothetical protein O8C61_12800 [Candidatus Methanoperedens sp.]|nr:hypothetical protein [Candidatus Methanoperedens sp.]